MHRNLKIFFATPPLNSARFRVRGLGIRERMPPMVIHRPHGTGDFLMMYFHTSTRAGCSDGADWIGAGSLVIWPPGECQYYGSRERKFLHSWIHCDGTLVARVLKGGGVPLSEPIPVPDEEEFLRFLSLLHHELATYSPPDDIIAENLLENWVRHLSRERTGRVAEAPERLRRALEFVEEHLADPLSLAELARQASLSPAHFSCLFRKYFGCPPMDYVIERRLHYAACLLRDMDLPVSEIARRAGYEDACHFSKLFKKRNGASPLEYRRAQAPGVR